jgi:hypothetical protein
MPQARQALGALDTGVDGIGLRRPTLDEVFRKQIRDICAACSCRC